jgi:ribonuclease HI
MAAAVAARANVFVDGSVGRRCIETGKWLAGVGVHVQSACGSVDVKLRRSIGWVAGCTQAERLAVEQGLQLARQMGFQQVTLYTDSMAVVKEHAKADKGLVEVLWTPRKDNSTADRLARRAVEKRLVEKQGESPRV